MIKRIFKKTAALILSACMVFTLTSCKSAGTAESENLSVDDYVDGYVPYTEDTSGYKIITYAASALPKSLDPAKVSISSSDSQLVYDTSEGLVRLYNNEVKPAIAQSWETEDNITYTFHLRNACWEDGTLIKAEDFLYSFKRLLNPDNGFALSENLLLIKNAIAYRAGNSSADDLGIEAVDSSTLRITLEEANPAFVEMLAADTKTSLVREDIVYVCGDDFASNPGTFLSCGPFIIKSWDEESVVLEKNENYWDSANIKLNRIVCKAVPDGATRAVMFDAGECNAYVEMLASNTSDYKDYKTMQDGTLVSLYLNFDKDVFQNDNFRKAVSLALNREQLASDSAAPGAVATSRIVPDYFGDFSAKYPVEEAAASIDNSVKAKECLQSALTEMEKTKEDIGEIVFVCQDTAASKELANDIISMLRANLGLTEIRLVPVSAQTAVDYYCNGNYDMYIGTNQGSSLDPFTQLSRWKSNSIYNFSGFESETLNANLSAYASSKDLSELSAAEKLILEYSPELPLFYRGFIYGYAPEISGIGVSHIGAKLELIYADIKKGE